MLTNTVTDSRVEPADSSNGRLLDRRNVCLPLRRIVVALLIILLSASALEFAVGAQAARSCPLPRELGAASWFLASMSSVDLCDLLSPPDEPAAHSGANPNQDATDLPLFHTVAEGETLSAIALRYDTSVEELRRLNDIDDPEALSIGLRLRLRDEGATSPVQPSSTAVDSVYACDSNADAIKLDMPYEPIRLAQLRGVLYLLAGGQLYGLPEGDLQSDVETVRPIPLSPRDGLVSGIPVQELVDLTVDDISGELVLLDKTGDLYGYHPPAGRWRVRMVAQRLPDVWLDPQFLTIANVGDVTYGLDVDGARLWRMALEAPVPVIARESAHLAGAVDVATMDGTLYLLRRDGTISEIAGNRVWTDVAPLAWPVDLNGGPTNLIAVDGDGRRVLLIGGDQVTEVILRFANMQRLRSATQSDQYNYAIAGRTLYRMDQTSLSTQGTTCPPVSYDNRFVFHGVDLQRDLPDLTLPFPGGRLPNRPRSYPGARRLYRFGIHEGVDFYEGDAPSLAYGSPVGAIAEGTVIRIDHDFREMTPAEYVPIMNEIYRLHSTPDAYLDKLRGQQVWIEHAPGIVSRYAHLSSVAPDLQVGDEVVPGQRLGGVGVSGTSSGVYQSQSGFHLHWEIWIGERYLGHGLTLHETMRLWRVIFGAG